MKAALKRLWVYLDGKKSNIALMYWTGTSLFLPIWFANGLPKPWDKVNLTVGTLGTLNAGSGSFFPTTSVLTADGLVNLDNSAVEILTLLGAGTVNLNTTALTLGDGTFSGALNSTGSLVKLSGGLLTLSGNNGYTGATSVNAGTLTLSGSLASTSLTVGTLGTLNAVSGSVLPTTSVLTADGVVNLFNGAVEIATLLGGGTVNLDTTALTLGAGTFSGALNATGSLVKVGGGLLTLSGNNGGITALLLRKISASLDYPLLKDRPRNAGRVESKALPR
jgi:autotransporter-associated beta strand protein